jgi:hypothetical protein
MEVYEEMNWTGAMMVLLGMILLALVLSAIFGKETEARRNPCCLKKDACKVRACECGCKP